MIGQFYTFNGDYSLENLTAAYGAPTLFLYDKFWRSKKLS